MMIAPPPALRIECRRQAGTLVIAARGVLDLASYCPMWDALVTAATAEPAAVIVELGGLTVPDPAVLTLFSAVRGQLAQWPGIPVLLVADGRHRTLLDRYRVSRAVPVHRTLAEAVRAVRDSPVRRIARRTLPNNRASAARVRAFIRSECARWGVANRIRDAEAVATELVENTIQHTYCAPSVRLELCCGRLTVAVYDDDPAPARLCEPPVDRPARFGLRIVARLSRAWGCTPTVPGGKVVWAVL